MFIKIIFFLICAFAALAIGAELETMFPNQPVTEIWMTSIVILLVIFGFKWALKTDNKRALKILSSSGHYSQENLNSMSYHELMLREKMHNKDPVFDWSIYTFKQLIEFEAEEKEAKSEEAVICRNCGHKMGYFQRNRLHAGIFANPCEKQGKFCIPIE
jgi:hypothetical protein